MTEEIIKECKNCDALGIDSEIGVYYCCLSHRQDDLPKEFTCNDFTPNKQLKRLEQKNFELEESLKVFNKPDVKKVLTLYNCGEITRLEQENRELKTYKDVNEDFKKAWNELNEKHKRYRSALEEIKNIVENLSHCKIPHEHCFQEDCSDCILDEIKKVLNDSEC